MDKIHRSNISYPRRKIFNSWRLFFQVNTVADITSYHGDKIRNIFINENTLINYRSSSKLLWPIQERPSNETFKIWLKGIGNITESDQLGNLNNKLGKWRKNPALVYNYHELIHTDRQHILIRNNLGTWDIHKLKKINRTIHFYDKDIISTIDYYEPNNYEAVEGIMENSEWKINLRNTNTYEKRQHNIRDTIANFKEFINESEDKIDFILDNLTIYDEGKIFNNNHLLIACDGSANNNEKGSFGISVANNQEIVATVKNKLPTVYGVFSSYRSEFYGIMTSTYLYQNIIKYAKNNNKNWPKVTKIICDNKASIDTINQFKNIPSTSKQATCPEADIIFETIHRYKQVINMGGKIHYIHIKGHQDKGNNKLSFEAELNILADTLANEGMNMHQMDYFKMPTTKTMLFLHGQPVCKNHKQVLKDAHQSADMRVYFQEKYGWSDKLIENIWWLIVGKAFPNFNASVQTTIIQYIHGRLPCNQKEKLYYEYRSDLCSGCGQQIETQEHVIQCNCSDMRKLLKKNYMRNLYRIMESNETEENTSRVIGVCINKWIHGEEIPKMKELADNPSKELIEAYKEQTTIGWDQFLKGRLSIKWGETYNKYKEKEKTKKKYVDAEKWGKDIIVVSWKFFLDIWRERNDNEHGNGNEANIKKKKKLVEKIKWLKTKNRDLSSSYTNNEDTIDLTKLPMDNLLMMETQLIQGKIDRREGGRGESLSLDYKK
jgi:hypothetical protein